MAKPMCSQRRMPKRVTMAVCLAAITALAWIAAPALSLRPYMTGAVDFEHALPAAKRIAPSAIAAARRTDPRETAPRWISPPIEAPPPFDLVGVARETRSVEIRVRDDGGRWSEW